MGIVSAGMEHQGRHRPHNEDSFAIYDDVGLYAVADGVESEPFGEKASLMAVQELGKIIRGLDLSADSTPPFEYAQGIPLPARALKFAFRELNRKIYQESQKDEKLAGMSTTLTALWIKGGKAYICNVGDSRAYLVRGARILQLTRDHTSLAQGEADQPTRLDVVEDFTSISEHELTRALGINPDIDVQLSGGTPKPGDVLLLCTDGLYQDIRNFEIQDVLKSRQPQAAAQMLINMANERGGKDNVALVVVQIT